MIVNCTQLGYNLRSPMDPETNSVVHCLRAFLSSADVAPLRGVLIQTADWQGIEAKSAFHGVAPIVAKVFLQNANDLAPEDVRQRSRNLLTILAQKNILWLEVWQRLLQTFDEAAIPVISFKGPALALTA